ncbi:MAG: hypothetical protein H0V79_05500 [Actinobacteria bacterium]|nr:hypothetical protein [Actinomycetota bacterium]
MTKPAGSGPRRRAATTETAGRGREPIGEGVLRAEIVVPAVQQLGRDHSGCDQRERAERNGGHYRHIALDRRARRIP